MRFGVARSISLHVGLVGILTVSMIPPQRAGGEDGTPVKVKVNDAAMRGEGDVLTITGIEVNDGGSQPRYLDVSCRVVLAPDGAVRFETVKAVPGAARPKGFVPGIYRTVDGEEFQIDGPTTTPDGRETWIAQSTRGYSELWLSATWTTGPLKDHPQLGSWKHMDTLPKGHTFGVTNGVNHFKLGLDPVLAVQQAGDNITFTLFSFRDDRDGPRYSQRAVIVMRRVGKK